MPRLLPALTGLLLALTLFTAAHAKPAPPDLFSLPRDEFGKLDAVAQPLIPGEVDRELLAAAVFHETNRVRVEAGLKPLHHDGRLDRAADIQVRSMIDHGYLDHENNFEVGMRWPLDRVLSTGYTPRAVSENLAKGFRLRYEDGRPYYRVEHPGAAATFSYQPDGPPIPPHTYASFARYLVDEWMHSPGHWQNLLRASSEELGVSIRFHSRDDDLDEAYAAQVFAQPR